MKYDIKAIPTTYAGVNFRSRLEARWAAFFDLCGWKWDYEPFDLEGWAPDFRLRTKVGPVLCEVKPVDLSAILESAITDSRDALALPEYGKAVQYEKKYQVCLLGTEPIECSLPLPVGMVLAAPVGAEYKAEEMYDELTVESTVDSETGEIRYGRELWRSAGNEVQWRGHDTGTDSHSSVWVNSGSFINRAFSRGA